MQEQAGGNCGASRQAGGWRWCLVQVGAVVLDVHVCWFMDLVVECIVSIVPACIDGAMFFYLVRFEAWEGVACGCGWRWTRASLSLGRMSLVSRAPSTLRIERMSFLSTSLFCLSTHGQGATHHHVAWDRSLPFLRYSPPSSRRTPLSPSPSLEEEGGIATAASLGSLSLQPRGGWRDHPLPVPERERERRSQATRAGVVRHTKGHGWTHVDGRAGGNRRMDGDERRSLRRTWTLQTPQGKNGSGNQHMVRRMDDPHPSQTTMRRTQRASVESVRSKS